MITTKDVDTAIQFLDSTIEEYAQAHSYIGSLKITEKIIFSQQTLDSLCKTLGLREAEARASGEYRRWERQYKQAMYDFDLIRLKRASAQLVWDRYQSELSAKKMGITV